MKYSILFTFLLCWIGAYAQQKPFALQVQVVDERQNPIVDAYLFNLRNSDKYVSRNNGIFDLMVLSGDTIAITHISYLRKYVSVYQLLINPVVKLEIDTINIKQINVSASHRSDYDKAMENINRIEFDFRQKPDDNYTETERMKNLLNTENSVERAYSNSLSLVRFSPSEQIGKWVDKHKKRKEANQFSSTKKKDKK